MPQYTGSLKPVNRILQAPPETELVEMEVGANATAADMVPGRIVIYDAADGAVKESAAKAADVLGVLEVKSGMAISDNYAVGDQCLVIDKPGARVLLTLITGGGAVAPGSPLVSAANGKAALQAVGAIGTQGMVVAVALASEDPSSADKTVVARLVMTPEGDTAT